MSDTTYEQDLIRALRREIDECQRGAEYRDQEIVQIKTGLTTLRSENAELQEALTEMLAVHNYVKGARKRHAADMARNALNNAAKEQV